MLYKKKDISFLRFGDLSPIKQDSYNGDTYHSAPSKKGFYAFISFMIEPFLLGGYNPIGTKHSKIIYVKDKDNNKIITSRYYIDKSKPPIDEFDEYFEYLISITEEHLDYLIKRYASKQSNLYYTYSDNSKTGFCYLTTLKKPKRFKYKGELWHHHVDETPRNLILKEKGCWVLTSFDTFVKSFNKALHNKNSACHEWSWKNKDVYGLRKPTNKSYSKDIFEVFFDRI